MDYLSAAAHVIIVFFNAFVLTTKTLVTRIRYASVRAFVRAFFFVAMIICGNVNTYIALYCSKCFTPVQLNIISISAGSIQPRCN